MQSIAEAMLGDSVMDPLGASRIAAKHCVSCRYAARRYATRRLKPRAGLVQSIAGAMLGDSVMDPFGAHRISAKHCVAYRNAASLAPGEALHRSSPRLSAAGSRDNAQRDAVNAQVPERASD